MWLAAAPALGQESELSLTIIAEDPLIFVPPSGPPPHLLPPLPPLPSLIGAPRHSTPAPQPLGLAADPSSATRRPSAADALQALGGAGPGITAPPPPPSDSELREGPLTTVAVNSARPRVEATVAAGVAGDRLVGIIGAELAANAYDFAVAGEFDGEAGSGDGALQFAGAADIGALSIAAAAMHYAGAGGRVAAVTRWHGQPGRLGAALSFASVAEAAASGDGARSLGTAGINWRTATSAPIGASVAGLVSSWSSETGTEWAGDLEATAMTTQWLPSLGLQAGAAVTLATTGVAAVPVLAAHMKLGSVAVSVTGGRLPATVDWLLSAPGGSFRMLAPLRQEGWRAAALIDVALAPAAADSQASLSADGGYAEGLLLRVVPGTGRDVALELESGALWWAAVGATGEGLRWRAKLRGVVRRGQHGGSLSWAPQVDAEAALLTGLAPLEWTLSVAWRPGPYYAAAPLGLAVGAADMSAARALGDVSLPLRALVGVGLPAGAWHLLGNAGLAWDRAGSLRLLGAVTVAYAG